MRLLSPQEEAGRDPKSKESLAADRRSARSARRRRDRFVRRQRKLMETLTEAGLMPADMAARKALEKLDPYYLRAAALKGPIEAHELGRAIFHLNQRRGFLSNRLTDEQDAEKSAMKQGMVELEKALAAEGCETLGDFLARRHARDRHGNRVDHQAAPETVRFRPHREGNKVTYPLYPARKLVEQELDRIWQVQAPHHPQLTDDLKARIKRIVIEQRPLKTPPVGRCTLRPDRAEIDVDGVTVDLGARAPKAHPLFQRFRILQDVAQLRVIARPGRPPRHLTIQERDSLVAVLSERSGHRVSFESLRKAIKLPTEARFNYELAGLAGFPPDQTAAKIGQKKALGKQWAGLSRERRIAVVEHLLAVEDPDALTAWLQEKLGIDAETAAFVGSLRLPEGHGQFGRGVLAALVEVMETRTKEDGLDPETGELFDRPLSYDEAVAEIGHHHSDHRRDGLAARLPYYGEALTRHVISNPAAPESSQERIGRVANPTVHIALNQVRKLVNALIDTYGPPTEVVIELSRELKQSRDKKAEIERENRENEKRNTERRATLAKHNVTEGRDAMLRLRLYEELPPDKRVCVFTGTPIGVKDLFSGRIEIEHVLPHSKTLDDSFMNKVLCLREANRRKGKRAPADVWSGAELEEIVARAQRVVPRKAWRFQPDAMERFAESGDFLARQLNDTKYMSRLAKTYLEQVCDQVWVVPGRLTAMLRGKWGLNVLPQEDNRKTEEAADVESAAKNRNDHRHHAIDAFVVANTDRGLLNRVARASAQAEEMDLDRRFAHGEFPEPYAGYRDDLWARLRTLVVSHKPDHGLPPGARDDVHQTAGRLHEQTAYGRVDEQIDGKRYNLVTRKPVVDLSDREIDQIRDNRVREKLQAHMAAARAREGTLTGASRRAVLDAFSQAERIYRVRVLKTEQSVRTVRHTDAAGQTFDKAYVPGDNHRVEIFELPDGTWQGEGVTMHDANQPGYTPTWATTYPKARLVMRLHPGDCVEADFENGLGRCVYRVHRLEPSAKRVRLAAHNEGGSIQARHEDRSDHLQWVFATWQRLQAASSKRVHVDVLGRVKPVRDGDAR
ncbi:MAG: type II CRISPR RNA-guided endonuclease Cas9 [Rhodovibrio sp.]|nr:type II CRISPR RNA-guided endonuclease Cas9 [Rhodovibrio sp.]